jgi:hypothetical protein
MGNINCQCIKQFQENELLSSNKKEKENNMYTTNDNNNFAESRNFNRTNSEKIQDKDQDQVKYYDTNNNIISKSKGQNLLTPLPEEEKNNQNNNKDNKIIPFSNNYNNYMEFSMDFFDEINKYRSDSDLFINLKKRFPSNITI